MAFLIMCYSCPHLNPQRFNAGVENLTNISECMHGFLDKLMEESKRLERHATHIDEVQTNSIVEFQKVYEVHCAYVFSV